ncbi:uncharacterized protein TRUGW13939_03511 [Talaromyces rugulosus]|uniref:DUF1279 domain-containing protein n=1 Tax=Talaromyces rugulosus TaxID=121627 RepID=A0A7H8QRE2_TALRU|nr:uncharacterized protein TRUGW13939_03511 [Talaromyces rugulosus]QKX56406.1 hypothetical protein TRUGW13939_03511 [Talaromyces rugulosus]
MPSFAISASQLLRRQAESAIHMGRLSARPLQRKPTSSLSSSSSSRFTVPRARFSTQRGTTRRAPKTSTPSALLQQQRTFFQKRFSSSSSSASSTTTKAQPQSLSQRLKTLSREYGWSALGVYLLLSALDFPFCFATVRLVGVERIGHLEHAIMDWVKGALGQFWPLEIESVAHKEPGQGQEGTAVDEHGVIEAERRNVEEGASIWTQLALAYAIHKSFIFLRVPLTAAVTPKVVQTLRRWGWNIGKRTPKGN